MATIVIEPCLPTILLAPKVTKLQISKWRYVLTMQLGATVKVTLHLSSSELEGILSSGSKAFKGDNDNETA